MRKSAHAANEIRRKLVKLFTSVKITKTNAVLLKLQIRP